MIHLNLFKPSAKIQNHSNIVYMQIIEYSSLMNLLIVELEMIEWTISWFRSDWNIFNCNKAKKCYELLYNMLTLPDVS